MKRSWIKLYIEILDDPKMGRIPDWLWKRAIELFLLAGENGDDGLLPPVDDMAWRLRTTTDKLTVSLQALGKVGVVHETQRGQWAVTNFKKRQYSESYERTRRYRDRHSNEDGDTGRDGVVTGKDSPSPSASSLGSVSRGEGMQGEGDVFRSFEQKIGPLTQRTSQQLGDDIDEFTADWVLEAIDRAVERKKRSLAYVEGVLRGFRREGGPKHHSGNGNGNRQNNEQIVAEVAHELDSSKRRADQRDGKGGLAERSDAVVGRGGQAGR